MANRELKKPYDAAIVEIVALNATDIVTASDLFTESETPGNSSSSGSWT